MIQAIYFAIVLAAVLIGGPVAGIIALVVPMLAWFLLGGFFTVTERLMGWPKPQRKRASTF